MDMIVILLLSGLMIYLVWNHFKLLETFESLKNNRDEFDIKIFDKFINLENEINKSNKIHNVNLNETIKRFQKLGTSYNELKNRIDKLELITSSPAYQSYQIFLSELENHKSKVKTTKGRISLNKELIQNMIESKHLEINELYSYADLQTIFMEYLQCKKNSTNSKIQRLTKKGFLKKNITSAGTLYKVNI